MPIYVFRCSRCDDEIEELRSLREYDDPPPCNPSTMCPETILVIKDDEGKPVLDEDGNETINDRDAAPCDYQRAMTTAEQRWPHGVPSNEGRGGWQLQPGGAMVKVTPGREKLKYGEGA